MTNRLTPEETLAAAMHEAEQKIAAAKENFAHEMMQEAIDHHDVKYFNQAMSACPNILSQGSTVNAFGSKASYMEVAAERSAYAVVGAMLPYYENLSEMTNQEKEACLKTIDILERKEPNFLISDTVAEHIYRLSKLNYGSMAPFRAKKYQIIARNAVRTYKEKYQSNLSDDAVRRKAVRNYRNIVRERD